MELGEWHNRLEKHFDRLGRDRSTIAPDRPIYGLEHGLGQDELKSLFRTIREVILKKPPSNDQRLPWIVYATEIGYDYAGDEYWQTFERETPSWTIYGDRYWLRRCFLWFHKEYGGAKPTGRWAEHFSIICWPITHAILPKDLQRQLAHILFELRHSFSAQLFESPTTLGELIASRSWKATSRFQNFAEETQLVSQIGAALLLQGKFGTEDILHEATLQRISKDLDQERLSREWLRSARKEAEKRATIRGLSFGSSRSNLTGSRLEKARFEIQELGIEPRLMLRPKDMRSNVWEVLLEIPDLSHLLLKFPHLRDILTNSRCVVAGSSGRPLPRGSFLCGSQRKTLSEWPASDEILLKFDREDQQLDYLLRTECLLRPGSTWLFRIASDNLAYEIRTLRVRPGERYILVNLGSAPNSDAIFKSIELACDGVYGVIIELPETLSPEWEKWLRSRGIGLAKTIEVWPAGLGALVWDGEGYGEWLASEQPCLALHSDHSIDSLTVMMGIDPHQSLEIAPVNPGETIFIELPELTVGLHKINFTTYRSESENEELLGDLDVVMRIREARPWSPGISPQGPLLVQIDPISPTLEQLWEGKIEVTLQGPEGRLVGCKLSLFENNIDGAKLIYQLPPIKLPVSPADWRDHFEEHFRKIKEVESAYDEARSVELYFSAEELGAFSIRCEREFTPLRWAVRRDKQGYYTRLFDDSGNFTPPMISYYTFEEPSIEKIIEHDSVYRVPEIGGLFVARQGTLCAPIIVSPTVTINKFSDLSCIPHFETMDGSLEAVISLLSLIELWSNARLPGDGISSLKQRDILLEVTRQIFIILGGKKWYEAESSVRDREINLFELTGKIASSSHQKGFAFYLAENYKTLAKTTHKERIKKFSKHAIKFLHLKSVPPKRTIINKKIIRKRPVQSADNPFWLSELALRLACDPSGVEAWAGEGLRYGLERLRNNPTLARAARFLVIAIDQQLGSRAIPGKLYGNWEWR